MLYGQITDEELIKKILDRNPRWKKVESHIKFITWDNPTNEFRFVLSNYKNILQQRYGIKVHFETAVSYGSYEAHWQDFDVIWVNVPAFVFPNDDIEL